MMELTKDAKHMLKTVYGEYLRRIKNGVPKKNAKFFENVHEVQSELFPTWPVCDINNTAVELRNAGFLKYYIRGGFMLRDEGIAYAENCFKNGVLTAVDVVSKLKP